MRGPRNLRRIPERGVVGGVCAGIAEYFDWNVRLLRALLVIVLVFSGAFPILVVYAVLWYVLDPAPPASGAGGEPGSRGATAPEVHERFARLDARLQRIEECVADREFELRRELKKLET
jgi:phage shock protein C